MILYLSRLSLAENRMAYLWMSNPYRIHQRLMMGSGNDPRLLFRLDEIENQKFILVQTYTLPQWKKAFDDFPILSRQPEVKQFNLALASGGQYRFRLRANPTVKRDGRRLGLFNETDQLQWIQRKFSSSGANLLDCQMLPSGFQKSNKSMGAEDQTMNHFSVLFEGRFSVSETALAEQMVAEGVGSAKAFGFGLLSLRRCSVE